MLRTFRALVLKEFIQIIRDPGSILIAFVMPLILLFLFGFGISFDLKDIALGVAAEDTGESGTKLASALFYTPQFAAVTGPRSVLMEALSEGRLKGVVVIPQDFSARLKRGGAQVQIAVDGSEPNTGSMVMNYTSAVIQRRAAAPPKISLNTRFWYNEGLNSRYFLVPGTVGLVMALIGTILTSLVIAREWERGTMEAIMSAGVTVGQIIVSKMAAYYVLGISSAALSVAAARFIFRVPFRGSFGALFLVASAFMIAAMSQGLLISTLAKNQFVASQGAILSAFLPSFLLSGFVFEISSMPPILQVITYAVPARYLMSSLVSLFLVGDVPEILIPNIAAMAFIGAVLLLLVAKVSPRGLD